jgi:hypothetical protein
VLVRKRASRFSYTICVTKTRTSGIRGLVFLALVSPTISPAVGQERNPDRKAYFGDEHNTHQLVAGCLDFWQAAGPLNRFSMASVLATR